MTARFVVTGTDTGIGKTVVSAMLVQALNARYFKPVQAGLDAPTDTDVVKALAEVPDARIVPEAYRLRMPASPHQAAAAESVWIDPGRLTLPTGPGGLTGEALIVEGAGGLMVPLNDDTLYIDIFVRWAVPVILCARTGLGTINHTLLSLEALKARRVPVHGVIFVGDEAAESRRIIARLGGARDLGRLPPLNPLTPQSLRAAFEANFRREDFFT